MIREYAVQPQLLTDRRMCRLLTDSFGISRGRLISRFPDIWEELVQWALAEAKPVQMAQIIEALARLKRRMIFRCSEWNGSGLEDWLEEAEREDGQRPFTAILANENPRKSGRVLQDSDLNETNPSWNVETTRTINRSAVDIADCAAMLIRSAKELIFVDPYFQANEPRYQRPLERMLSLCVRTAGTDPLLRIEFHTSTNCGSEDHLRRACSGNLAQIVPAGIPFQIVRWEPNVAFHNRYVLTNRGGLIFGHGLDDGAGTDDVSILSDSTHVKRWREFQRSSATHTFVDQFPIVGNRR